MAEFPSVDHPAAHAAAVPSFHVLPAIGEWRKTVMLVPVSILADILQDIINNPVVPMSNMTMNVNNEQILMHYQ